jgi:hypothetical protein
MRSITSTITAACAALALTAGVATAQTVPPDRTTKVTISGPVSVPGMTLPAGSYTFRIMDSLTDRNVVQIFNQDGTKLLTTLLAIPATRPEPTGDPVILFKETPSTQPPALHYWYYAGDTAGNELVYPKQQAQQIANAANEPVMAVDGTNVDDMKAGSISRVSPANTAAASASSSSSSTTPATPPDSTSQSAAQQAQDPNQPPPPPPPPPAQSTTPQPAPAPTPQPAPATPAYDSTPTPAPSASAAPASLPKTASELPLVGLIGLVALGGAIAIRAARMA